MFSYIAAFANFLLRIFEFFGSFFETATPELQLYRKQMNTAKNYDDWHHAALNYDKLSGKDKWKQTVESDDYDYKLIANRLAELRCSKDNGDIEGLIHFIRTGLIRGIGGINNLNLHRGCFVNTKKLIEEYIDEFSSGVSLLNEANAAHFAPLKKSRCFFDMLQAFGRTALCLSGGGSLGLYHFGVVKCLFEFGLLPEVISGASIGALITALLGVYRDDELPKVFEAGALNFKAFEGLEKGSAKRKITRFLKHGYLMDIEKLKEFCLENIGDFTFLEAYNRTGRIINIAVASRKSSEVPWLLNYLTTPNVLIWSAALASCATPGMYGTVNLIAKNHLGEKVQWNPSKHQWTEQSLESEMPMTRLAELFNVNHFIVSQVNPHVVPFLSNYKRDALVKSRLISFVEKITAACMNEILLRAMQASILIPSTFRFFQHILTQKYVGDITIVPNYSITEMGNIFKNPNEEFFLEAIEAGERSTWPYISQIRTSMKIEMTLAECMSVQKYGKKEMEERMRLMRNRDSRRSM